MPKTDENQSQTADTKTSKKSTKKSLHKKKRRKSKGKRGGARARQIWPESRTTTMACKFYDEQTMLNKERQTYVGANNKENKSAPESKQPLTDEQKQILKQSRARFVQNIHKLDPKIWECLAILHDKDTVHSKDDVFETAIKKPHWHLIIRRCDKKRFSAHIVFELLGINYDSKVDFGLFTKHGCETIVDFYAYSAYLPHWTIEAQRELKHVYEVTDIVSNQPLERVKELIDAYNHAQLKETMNAHDWDNLAHDAEQWGKDGKAFFDFKKKFMTIGQQSDKRSKIIEEYYNDGLQQRMNSVKSRPMIAVLIHGTAGIGKSYTAGLALNDIYGNGNKVLKIAPGSGMYDNITPETKAVILDDVRPTDVYNLADHTPHPLHRRNSGNGVWLGDYVIATTNEPLKVWFGSIARRPRAIPKFTQDNKYYADLLQKYGFSDYAEQSAYAFFNSFQAALSRFYVCTINYVNKGDTQFKVPQLTVENEPHRGIPDPKEIALFDNFRTRYNTYLENYFWEQYKRKHPNFNAIIPIHRDPQTKEKEDRDVNDEINRIFNGGH